jgi:hypothetical protein
VTLLHDWQEPVKALADRAIDIALGKRFRSGREHRDLLDPGGQGVFKASKVRRERRVGDTLLTLDAGEHLCRTCHLRHPFGGDEAADLDVAQAGMGQVIHQADFIGNVNRAGFVLQAVSWADFYQAYALREGHGRHSCINEFSRGSV